MDEITSKVVLALLKKGLDYEINGYEAEIEMEIPSELFGSDTGAKTKMKMEMKVDHATFKISRD